MKRYLRTLLCLLGTVFLVPGLSGQDAHFSQFFASPTTLNPALTGLFSGRYRVAINHRSQWAQVLATPFSTSSFAADFHYDLNPRRRGTDSFGGGILFLNDRVPEVGWSSNQVMLAGAFHKTLDARGERVLSLGGQAGVAQRSLGYGNLTFQDEFNGVNGFNQGSGLEVLPENSVSFGDYHLGLNYSYRPARGVAYFAGVALHHLTKPETSFYATQTAGQDVEITSTLDRKYGVYFNLRMLIGRGAELSPRIYYLQQGSHAMANVGSNLRLPLDDGGASALHLGTWIRLARNTDGFGTESVAGLVGFEVASFLFGLSYDAGISSEAVSPRHRGAFELSVTYTGLSEDDEAVPCPKF